MALIDTIQKNLATTGSEPVAATDQTSRARQLLAAKSGKQIGAAQLAPQSAVAEAVAGDQTRQQLEALKPAGQLAAAQVGQQQAELAAAETGARADLDLRRQQLAQQNNIRKQQLLADAAREGRKLDFDRDAAKLEQIAHTMRLADKKYTDKLEMEGQRQRLDNELAFKEALQKSIFGSNTDLLTQGLGNKSVLEASDREFAERMGQMDIETALKFADNEMRDAKQAATIGAVGSLATAGIGAYGQYANSPKSAPTAPAPTTAAQSTSGVGGMGSSTKYSTVG